MLLRFPIILVVLFAAVPLADAQTKLPSNLEISLLPGYVHQPLQGIDSIVGKITKKGKADILYEIGGIPKPGAPRLGGQFVNQAIRYPANMTLWRKQQKIGGRTVYVAYTKTRRLMVSIPFEKIGVNLSAEARTTEDVAEILLMAVTLREKKRAK